MSRERLARTGMEETGKSPMSTEEISTVLGLAKVGSRLRIFYGHGGVLCNYDVIASKDPPNGNGNVFAVSLREGDTIQFINGSWVHRDYARSVERCLPVTAIVA